MELLIRIIEKNSEYDNDPQRLDFMSNFWGSLLNLLEHRIVSGETKNSGKHIR